MDSEEVIVPTQQGSKSRPRNGANDDSPTDNSLMKNEGEEE